MNKKTFLIFLILIFMGGAMQIGGAYGQSWPQKPDSRFAAQEQAQKPERPPCEIKAGEKPNLDNLEYWSDISGFNLRKWQLSEQFQTLDLRDKYDILTTCIFDSFTPWPPKDKMPPNFDPRKIIDIGKGPGLGVTDLHKQGVTGKGVKVAIIDQGLSVEHDEYKDNVAKYTNINHNGDTSLHGPAVTSLLVGNNCGVAPGAKLYYWAASFFNEDYDGYVKALEEIMQHNKENPKDPIRVVSISLGFISSAKNFDKWEAKLKEAKNSGLIVIHCSNEFLDFAQCPLDKDRNNPDNYDIRYSTQGRIQKAVKERGEKARERFFENCSQKKRMYVPIDNRSFTSGFGGAQDYVFGAYGGASWSPPYLAGVMALGLQIDPTLDEDTIYKYLRETGTPFKKTVGNKEYDLGWIINPKGFIDRVKAEKK